MSLTHVAAQSSVSSPLPAEQLAAALTCHILFTHFSAEGHLGEHSHVGFAWIHEYVLNSPGPVEREGHMVPNFYSAKLVSTANEARQVFTSSARAVPGFSTSSQTPAGLHFMDYSQTSEVVSHYG